MILRKASDILEMDILDIEGGLWCVEGAWVSSDSRHIEMVLSNRGVNLVNAQGKIDPDALRTHQEAVLKRLKVRSTDYITIKTVGIIRPFKED
jgi:hypothetical protein